MDDVVVHLSISRSRRRSFRQRFRSRSHVRYSMKTFLSLVPAGSGGCSTLLAIPAARRRGTGSRGEIPQGFALSRSEYGGLSESLGDLGFRHTKKREQGRRLGQDGIPNSATWQALGGGGNNGGSRRLGFRFRGERCREEGHPCPFFYRWEG